MNGKIKLGIGGLLVLVIVAKRKQIKEVPYKIVEWIFAGMIPE